MTNTFISSYRRRDRMPLLLQDGVVDRMAVPAWPRARRRLGHAPRRRSAGPDARRGGRQALRELPDDFRTVVYLADVEGYTYTRPPR